ncbi:predicted protein [Naegleria gruberi]|uniref:Predicted protein n=1 Tax=Naegleria gruberi TaxID=5762 RepID=D2VZ61_NAEGR|nr:uncharacterized protein NAEGRDRAFT_74371 [Naegleria gruberi]EFC37886.1 predicted protein [Naegleria gruberi]|eukprot:XP_002670630.1 predicted protein [Naegleria gruberi strain NEG-M]
MTESPHASLSSLARPVTFNLATATANTSHSGTNLRPALKIYSNYETTASTHSGDDEDAVSAQPTSVEEGSTADKISSNQFTEEYIVPSLKSIRTHPWDDLPHVSSLLIFGIIQPIQFIALSFIPIDQWGSISRYIIDYGIKSMYTFGLHLLPYEGSAAFLFIFLLLEMLCGIALYLSKESIGKDAKLWKLMPKIYTYMTFLCTVLYLPITSIYSTFWSCDYVHGKKEVQSDITSTITTNYYLKVYPDVECWDTPNLVFSIFSMIGLIFHIVAIPVLFTLTVASPSIILVPTKIRTAWWHRVIKKAFFNTLRPIVPVAVSIMSGFYIVFQQMVPSYTEFSFLYPSVMIAIAIASAGIIIYTLPYHRPKENSFQFAVNLAKLGPSSVMLICSLQNTISDVNHISGTLYQWEAGLIYLGTSLASCLTIFLFAFFGCQAYQKIYIEKLAKQLNEKISENSGAFSNDLLEDIGETNMGRVAQFALNVDEKAISKVDIELLVISKKIITEMKRNKLTPTDTFFASSLSCLVIKLFKEKDPRYGIMYSLQLLSGQLKRRINIWDRLVISLQKHEKDVLKKREEIKPGSRKAEEIDKKISQLYKKQTQLSNLHRNYWKLVLNENSDDSNAILQVSDELYILQNETRSMFEELFSQHSTSVTVLRNYSRFAEKFLFQPELAEDLQAAVLEEEEENNRKKQAFKGGRRGSRAVPGFQQETIDLSKFDDLDELPEEAECLEEENRKQKEGNKNLINKHPDFTWLLIVILIIPCYVILGITGGLIAEIIQGTSTKGSSTKGFESKVWMYYELCDAANVPFYVLVDYRALQKLKLFSGNTAYITKLEKDHKERFSSYSQRMKSMMLDYSSSTDNLISAVVKGYQQTYYEVYIPKAVSNASSFQEGTKKKVTLSEIYSMMAVQLENIVQQDDSMSLKTIENFPFMFFWENREIMPTIISNFCSTIIEDHRNLLIDQLRDFILGMSIAMASFMMVAFGIFGVIIYKFRDRQRLINLFKKLPKDEVGRIYQELKAGCSNDKHSLSNDKKQFILTRFLRNPVYAVPSLLMLSFAIGGIAFSVFIYDSTNNMNLQYSSMLKLRNSVDIQVDYHKGLFNLVELISGDSSLPTNSSLVYNEVTNSMRGLVDNFLVFTRGDSQKGYNPIRSFSTDIEILMISNTCSNNFTSINRTIGSNTTSTTLPASSKTWNSNFTLSQNLDFFSCLSIEDLMSYILSGMEQFKEESFKNIRTSGYFIETFFKDHVSLSLSFRAKVDKVLLVLVSVIDNIVSITPSLTACLMIVVLCMLINYIVFTSWKVYTSEMTQLRHMFHFISWETIESNEIFLNYIMNYELVRKKKGSRIHPGDEGADSDSTTMLKKVLDSCVDGAVIFNQEGIVENINQVALSMFGIRSQSDVVGTEFYGLFQSKDVIAKTISDISKSANSHGEILEVEAKRSQNMLNSKTFPVRLNLCVAFSGGKSKKVTFAGILSDVTSEKKSLELLNVEKKKSEDLLKSIFPEAVAARLKKGDTFIAEKFDDITCFFSDMVGFTKMSSTLQPTELVEMLNDLVNGFDEVCTKYNLEKIKTIGDAYFAAG